MIQLRKQYIGLDKSAQIGVINPRTCTVSIHFKVTQAQIVDTKQHTTSRDKYLHQFEVDVVNDNGKLIAKALKTLYIRKKPKK